MLFPKRPVFALFFCAVLVSGSAAAQRGEYAARATAMLDSLYTYYSVPGTRLLRENYPDDGAYKATYLAGESAANESFDATTFRVGAYTPLPTENVMRAVTGRRSPASTGRPSAITFKTKSLYSEFQ